MEREDGACVCPPDEIAERGRCVGCGSNERAVDGACVCKSGFDRATDGSCQERPADAGVGRDDAGGSAECDSGVCTPTGEPAATCVESVDCAEDELCDVHDSSQCVSKPAGLGLSCESDADCADSEATYCEVYSSSTCQIQGCAERAGVCPGDMACCDFAVLARSLCIPASRLDAGECPAPGELVERQSR